VVESTVREEEEDGEETVEASISVRSSICRGNNKATVRGVQALAMVARRATVLMLF
jgi:hypothetical protein